MIDTHCHLDRLDDVGAAVDPRLAALVTIGTGIESSRRAIDLATRIAKVHAAVGVHPNDASTLSDGDTEATLRSLARDPHVVAVGETGFDDHWKNETLGAQRAAFDVHASVAREVAKPLVLHVRDGEGGDAASRAAIDALRDAHDVTGILHCFSGHERLLETGLDLGWYVSFAGNVTYPSARAIRASAHLVPLDRLLVETDAPFLAPVPHRGRRNEPRFVVQVAEALAHELNLSLEELEPILDANARAVYRLPGR